MSFVDYGTLVSMVQGTHPVSIPENVRIILQYAIDALTNAPKAIVDNTISRTYTESDYGGLIIANNAGAITHTLPNDAPVGVVITVVQKGAGAITFDPDTGATLVNASGHDSTAAQWATASVIVVGNSDGESAQWLLVGNTA